MRPRVVELSVGMAMDRKASHRELTSVLISDLYGKAISAKDIQMGFDNLLDSLKDLTIDSPEAPKVSEIYMYIIFVNLCYISLKWATQVCRFPFISSSISRFYFNDIKKKQSLIYIHAYYQLKIT